MRHLTATLCLTLAVLLGSAGISWSADFQKGLAERDQGGNDGHARQKPPAIRVNYGREADILNVFALPGRWCQSKK